MSGFAGVISTDGAPVDENLVRRLAEQLEFRGPDRTTVRAVDRTAAFCFAFAKTGPAPQSGTLPITVDGQQWLIGDIRVDGRDALRQALSRKEHLLGESSTDEELALHAWRVHRCEAGSVLLGEYSFGVWEPGRRQFSALRDVIGAKPFFYAQVRRVFYFSNTLDVLRIAPGADLHLDEHFIGDFLLQGWCSDLERTVYRGIRRLKPGHLLELRDGKVAQRRVAQLPIQDPLHYRRDSDYVEQFRALLNAAVRERLPHGKAAFYMSGGLDSTSVAVVAVQERQARRVADELKAFTVDFRPLFDDLEPYFAGIAARHLGMPIELVKAGEEVPFANWTGTALRLPEPLHEPFQSRHVALAKDISSFSRVVLSGDGGDDILTGVAAPYVRHLLRQGKFFQLARSFGTFLWRKKRLPAMGTGWKGRWRNWQRPEPRRESLPSWVRPEFASRIRLPERLKELECQQTNEHPIHPLGYAALSQGFWAGVLEDEDAAWLGVPLERRSPFLDRRVVEFLFRVPPVPWCMEKELLREAMRGLLPEEVRTRRKTPLVQSPFAAQVARLDWKPVPLSPGHSAVTEFVDWHKLEATLAGQSGSELWDDLRPLTLNSWVKAVENDSAFRYSQKGRTE